MTSTMLDQRLFSFGLITDVQYADVPDCQNYKKTAWRYYRKALPCLQNALHHLTSDQGTLFTLQLGDLIDGQSRRNGVRDSDWKRLQNVFERYKKPVMHCVGNHDLYNFNRDELISTFIYPDPEKLLFSDCVDQTSINGDVNDALVKVMSKSLVEAKLCCYHFSPYSGFRFINLDCYDESTLGYDTENVKFVEAMEFLNERNPNKDKNSPENALHPHYVQYNGGVGREQLRWLDDVLIQSDEQGERVVVFGHIPIHPSATGESELLWNYEEMLDLLSKHRSVVIYLAGHDHDNGAYCCDESGIHHCTFNSVVQAVPKNEGGNETAYAAVDVYRDGMEIRGFGDITSHNLKFRSVLP